MLKTILKMNFNFNYLSIDFPPSRVNAPYHNWL